MLSWERVREFIFGNYELGIENYEFANFGKKGEWGKKFCVFLSENFKMKKKLSLIFSLWICLDAFVG